MTHNPMANMAACGQMGGCMVARWPVSHPWQAFTLVSPEELVDVLRSLADRISQERTDLNCKAGHKRIMMSLNCYGYPNLSGGLELVRLMFWTQQDESTHITHTIGADIFL